MRVLVAGSLVCCLAFAAACGGTTSSSASTSATTAPAVSVSIPTETVLTAPTPPTTSTDIAATGEVDAIVFAGDVQKLGGNLTQFGLTLQAAAQGPAALAERSTLLRSQLDDFDAIIGRMAGYTVSTPEFESKRLALVAAGPDVTSSGRELLDAAVAGDVAKLGEILPRFQTALTTLQNAVTDG
jgi:hypothetical protein